MPHWIVSGAVIDEKYRVERVLGQGGMGMVVAARHLAVGHLVAIKFPLAAIATRPDAAVRILGEARASMVLRSEHVARVFDVGVHPQAGPFLVMEYLSGQDLAAHVATRGSLATDLALGYILQACEALSEAHAHRIIHRDFKPSNLFLLQSADGSPLIKVIDFGLAKRLEPADTIGNTASGAVLGSPLFMAPEQMRGEVGLDARTDIWAIGATLFAVLIGNPPFPGRNLVAVYDRILAGPPRLRDARPDLSPELEAAVQRCLSPLRSERFHSVADLAEALALAGPPQGVESAARVRRIHERCVAELRVATADEVGAQAQGGDTASPAEASWRDAAIDHSRCLQAQASSPFPSRARRANANGWPLLAATLLAILLIGYAATRAPSVLTHTPRSMDRLVTSLASGATALERTPARSEPLPLPVHSTARTVEIRPSPKRRSVAPFPPKPEPVVAKDPLADPD